MSADFLSNLAIPVVFVFGSLGGYVLTWGVMCEAYSGQSVRAFIANIFMVLSSASEQDNPLLS